MLDKEKFLNSRTKKPFTKTSIDSLGEIGVRLIKTQELKPWLDLNLDNQVQFAVVDDKGELVFNDDDIKTCISEMTIVEKNDIINVFLECNGLKSTQKDVKKN